MKLPGEEGNEAECDDDNNEAVGTIIHLIDNLGDINRVMGWCRKFECPFDETICEKRCKGNEIGKCACQDSCFRIGGFVQGSVTP